MGVSQRCMLGVHTRGDSVGATWRTRHPRPEAAVANSPYTCTRRRSNNQHLSGGHLPKTSDGRAEAKHPQTHASGRGETSHSYSNPVVLELTLMHAYACSGRQWPLTGEPAQRKVNVWHASYRHASMRTAGGQGASMTGPVFTAPQRLW